MDQEALHVALNVYTTNYDRLIESFGENVQAIDPFMLEAGALISPRKTRRRPPPRPPRNPNIRILYDEFIRQDCGYTRFARWCGVTRQTVWNWLNELDYPRKGSRRKLLERTGIALPPAPKLRRRQ
jgi:hypothetical protein